MWEIAIKHRVGKLLLDMPLDAIAPFLESLGIGLLSITASHVTVELEALPKTKDPFDRLLLGICAFEQLRLVTLDRSLRDHPLAWRPSRLSS